MNIYNFDEFEWFLPEEKSGLAISITSRDTFNINPKLLEKLPSYIEIGICDKGRTIAMRENSRGFHLPKSGTLKTAAIELIGRLVKLGIRLPARYTITQNGDTWVGKLEAQAPPCLNVKVSARKKPASELTGLISEVSAK